MSSKETADTHRVLGFGVDVVGGTAISTCLNAVFVEHREPDYLASGKVCFLHMFLLLLAAFSRPFTC